MFEPQADSSWDSPVTVLTLQMEQADGLTPTTVNGKPTMICLNKIRSNPLDRKFIQVKVPSCNVKNRASRHNRMFPFA